MPVGNLLFDEVNALSISADGKSIILDATGVIALGEDITFTYTVEDEDGNTASADVTLEEGSNSGLSLGGTGGPGFAFTNKAFSFDVNNDGFVSLLDVAAIRSEIINGGSRSLPQEVPNDFSVTRFIDTNGNSQLDALDYLGVLEFLAFGENVEQEFIAATMEAPVVSQPAAEQATATPAPVALVETSSVEIVDWTPIYPIQNAHAPRFEGESLEETSSEQQVDSYFESQAFEDHSLLLDSVDSPASELSSDLEDSIEEIASDLDEIWEEEFQSAK